jgi:hypothetical protein
VRVASLTSVFLVLVVFLVVIIIVIGIFSEDIVSETNVRRTA